ncbi:MAG: mechanosensitive ion channel family protein, partial [Oceanicaulis sp.]
KFDRSTMQEPAPAETRPPVTDEEISESVSRGVSRLNEGFQELTLWVQQNQDEALTAAGVAGAIYLLMLVVRMIVHALLKRLGRKDETAFPAIVGRAVGKIGSLFLLLVAVFIAMRLYQVPGVLNDVMRWLVLVAAVLQVSALAQEIAVSLLQRKAARAGQTGSDISNAVSVLKWLIIGAIWIITIIVLLDTAGVQVTALIAGLGVGGIAIGLAAQGIFSDLFASLSILFDKPFKKGDFVVFGAISGTVEEIGLRTTRIRSLSGEQISVSNTDLIGERVHNFQRLMRRRFVMTIGVIYQTPADVIEAIPRWIKEDLDKIETLTFDRAHFSGFGDSALNFEIVFWVEAPEYPILMDKRQEAGLAIMRRFEKEGVDFAYPTRTVFIAGPGGAAIDPREQSEA